MKLPVLIAVIVVALGSIAHAQIVVLPPVEMDLGATTARGSALARPITTETSIGVSWAALAWLPSRVDVGAGFVATSRDVLPGVVIDPAARVPGSGERGALARSTDGTPPPASSDLTDRLRGGYVSLGYAVMDHDHVRIWLGGRLEIEHAVLAGRTTVVTGQAARIAVELYQWDALARGTDCGAGVRSGAIGIGAYVELSHRDLPPELGRDATTVGAFLRIPFVAAAGGGGHH